MSTVQALKVLFVCVGALWTRSLVWGFASHTAQIHTVRSALTHGRPSYARYHTRLRDLVEPIRITNANEVTVDSSTPTDDRSSRMSQNDHDWHFLDTAKIFVCSGAGGDGCVAWRREFRVDEGGPFGGRGGNGGSIYFECDRSLNTLSGLRSAVHYRAEAGQRGRGKGKTGRNGVDLVLQVPAGTLVFDDQGRLAGELKRHGERLLVAAGGRGGRGNLAFKTSRNSAPSLSEHGTPADARWLRIELKLLADVGFVGVPNAGKSSLLAAATNSKPKIADYPFTTVVPNLGVCDFESGSGLALVDIPGLLEGAHEGVGMGVAFLRHIQRCRTIVHVVNGESVDPVGDFEAINQELRLFNPRLGLKPQVVVLNKIDLPHVREQVPRLIERLKASANHTRVLGVSALTKENVPELMRRVRNFVVSLPPVDDADVLGENPERVSFIKDELDDRFEVLKDKQHPNQFRVVGEKIESIVRVTNWEYYEALVRFQRILSALGVNQALAEKGAKDGDVVMIAEFDFKFASEMTPLVPLGADDHTIR